MLTAAAALEAEAVFLATREQLTQLLREKKAKAHRQAAEPLLQDLLRRPAAERWRRVEEDAARGARSGAPRWRWGRSSQSASPPSPDDWRSSPGDLPSAWPRPEINLRAMRHAG